MTLTLHHIKHTRSLRPLWLLEEMGLDYELVIEGANIGEIDKTRYRAKNPLAKMPVLFDGKTRVMESVATLQYLADVHGGDQFIRKPGDADYGDFLQLLHFGEGGMGGYTSMLLGHTLLLPEKLRSAKMAAWARGELANCMEYLEGEIRGDYLLGDFTIADISVAYILYLLKISRNADSFGNQTAEYFRRVTARDAWVRASSK